MTLSADVACPDALWTLPIRILTAGRFGPGRDERRQGLRLDTVVQALGAFITSKFNEMPMLLKYIFN